MAVQTSFSYRFADFEVRELELRVIRSGEPLALEPKAFRVLVYLLRNAGRLVPKEELLTAIWGDTAVTDNSLTRAIALLRRSLEDDPRVPRYIETVSTAGYRFICPVESGQAEVVAAGPGAAALPQVTGADPRTKGKRPPNFRRIALAGAGAALCAIAATFWYALRPVPRLHIVSYRQITSVDQGPQIAGTDGGSLYLNLSLPNGNGVVPVSGGRVVPLSVDLPESSDSPNDSPAIMDVSPDGSKLLLGSGLEPNTGRKLWIVDTHGGGARYLAKGNVAIWSPDGGTVLYSTLHGDLYTIPSEGGEPRLLLASPASPGAELGVNDLAWSPDGKRIRFARDFRYWEVAADGSNPRAILPNWHADEPLYFMCCGHWAPNGDSFLFLAGTAEFSRNLGAARQLWALDERRSWLHRADPEPVQLTNGATIWGAFAFSRDGKTVYCTGITLRGELVRYDAKARQLLPYLGGISAEFVSFSRDGKYLVYVAYPEGTMWRANRDGSGAQQLTGPPFHPITPEWSPDGTEISFSELEPSHRGVMYIMSSQGGMPKRLLADEKAWAAIPDWSPDGKKIAFDQIPVGTGYGAYLSTGFGTYRYHVEKTRILELDTGKLTDLPPCPKGCFSPRWSPDGRYILEIAIDHHDLMLLDLRTNRWTRLNPGLGAIDWPRWSRDSRSIYLEDGDLAGVLRSTNPGIYRLPLTGGRAEKVVDLKGFRGAGSLLSGWSDLDPDDAPLLLRNVGTYGIYALSLERK